MRSAARLSVLFALLCALALACSGQAAASTGTGAVQVQGAQLIRDGAQWLPRGVQIVGLVAPQGSLTGRYVAANAHFSEAELKAARNKRADVIRFQVSQYGLDPEDPLYSPAYVQQVRTAVQDARSLGLTAIVSLQAETPAGRNRACPEPDAGAQRAWQTLVPMFAGDPGVMFELFNEPSLLPSATNWQVWANGGVVPLSGGTTCDAVGMQTLIDQIRSEGATSNVIIVPGLAGEQTLAGMPPLSDPSSPLDPQLAYGIHYPSLTAGSTSWDKAFGDAAASGPVIVTEWYVSDFHLCTSDEPQRAAWLLAYLASKQIGVVGYAFDVPGTIVADWSYAPTTFVSFACGAETAFGATPSPGPHEGPGQLLFNVDAGLAQGGGRRDDDPQAWVVDYNVVRRLVKLAPGQTLHFFNTPRTFVIGASARSLARLGLVAAIPTASFTSETKLASAVSHKRLPGGTTAVVFDDEHSRKTPHAQQQRPALYYQRAAQVAHKHALLLIAAPSPTLRKSKSSFLNDRVAAGAARYADVLDIQAQGLEARHSAYNSFVQAVAFQATEAHPDVELVSGLTTDPTGRGRPSSLILGALHEAASTVSGSWLEDPTGRYDSAAVAVLRALSRQGF